MRPKIEYDIRKNLNGKWLDSYQASSSVRYLSHEYSIANVIFYKCIKEFSSVKLLDTEAISFKEYEKMKKRIVELEIVNEILKSYHHINRKHVL